MTLDETSQRLLASTRESIEQIVNGISNAFRLFGASMDEAVLNIRIKQSRDPKVK